GRRLAALRTGFPESARLAGLRARTSIHPGRGPGRLGGAGRAGTRAAANLIAQMRYLLVGCIVFTSFVTAALGASGRQQAPPGSFGGAPPQFTHFTAAELSRRFVPL